MRNIYFTILTIILLLGDILSKYLAERLIDERIEILGDVFSLSLVHNTGIAFSLALPAIFLKILTLVLIFWIIYYYFFSGREKREPLKDIAVSLILAGAIWNGIERIFQGYVVDFLSVKYFSVFNLADVWISLGALLIFYIVYKHKTPNS